MSNTSRSVGLRPIRHLSGAPWNNQVSIYYHSTAATAVWKGSLVSSDAAFTSATTCHADPLGVHQSICIGHHELYTTGGLIGVAWTFGNTPQLAANVTNLNAVNMIADDTSGYIGVIDDPSVIYEVQGSDDTWVSSNIGDFCDSTGNSTGNATSGRSTCLADYDSLAATILAFRILRLVPRADNEIGAHCKLEVMLAESLQTHAVPVYPTS
jgi:hypothetical protein